MASRLNRLSALTVAGAWVVLLSLGSTAGLAAQEVESAPPVILANVPFSITLRGAADATLPVEVRTADGRVLATDTVAADATARITDLRVTSRSELPLQVRLGGDVATVDATFAPGWFSILPPLVAIALALVFREVITSLFAGIWLGALAVAGWNPLTATWRVVDRFAAPALADIDHTQIVIFTLLLGGMVGVIARNGGTLGIVEKVAPFAKSGRRGKIGTWLAGLAIFFDDYANTLIVGNTMRPITDRLKISREKLAYIVDSTAAPVAALVPISTWVGYEIGLIGDGLRIAAEQQARDPGLAAELAGASPFGVFLHTIPYLFYPLLALALVFLTSVMNRDFGPMAQAERRAARGQGLWREGAMLATDTSGHMMDSKEGAPHRWWNAGLPVITVIVVVVFGLYHTGRAAAGPGASLMDVFGEANPFSTLLWGSLAGSLVSILISVGQRILTVSEAMEAWLSGIRAMMIAMIILVLAWSLGAVTETLGTAEYLAQVLSERLPMQILPVMVFITAAVIAFSTGTSWATMAILLPLVIPLTVSLGGGIDFDAGEHYTVLLGVISSVLAGAIFGDHCSPISDTTVLSSMGAGCDHVDHVRTQLPYALLVAVLAMLLGDIPTAYGLPNWISLVGGVVVLYLVLRFRGVAVHEAERAPAAAPDVVVPR